MKSGDRVAEIIAYSLYVPTVATVFFIRYNGHFMRSTNRMCRIIDELKVRVVKSERHE